MIRTESRTPADAACARWLAALDRQQVGFLVLDAESDRDLLAAARTHPTWTVDYDDGESVLLARSPVAIPGQST